MPEEYGNIYRNQCLKLREVAARSRSRVEHTLENRKKFVSLEKQIEDCNAIIETMTLVMAKTKKWFEDIDDYNAQRKKDALMAINSALSVAGVVVPASMKGIHFTIDGRDAWLETEEKMDVDRVEGSGYKGTVSTYLRNIVLKANPDLLQFLILDEPLTKLSEESSAIFSTYVPLLADKMQIIWIEHKKEVFANVENKWVYRFYKDENDYTMVMREE